MNFSRSGWFEKYLEFRGQNPLPEKLPTHGIKVVENPSFQNDLEQAIYYFLQPTGILYGGLIEYPFPGLEYPKSRYFDSVDRVFMVFLEALFACLLADRHFLLDDLVEEESRFAATVDLALGYFLHIPPGSPELSAKTKAGTGFLGMGEGLHKKFEREIGRRITRGAKLFAHPDLFNNSFLFLDLYGCLLWQRKIALEPDNASEQRALLHEAQMRQRKTLLKLIISAGWIDGPPAAPERRLIQHFLKSSGLPKNELTELRLAVKKGLPLDEVEIGEEPWIVRRFYLELILLMVLVDRVITPTEMEFVEKISGRLELWETELLQSQSALEVFLIANARRFNFLQNRSTILHLKERLQERAVLAVKKNLDHVVNEIRETKELYSLLIKAAKTDLSQEEKNKVRDQLLDILKTIPALAIFALPGGGVLLPVLIKILPFKVLPSSFED